MSEAKFTKGPWNYEDGCEVIYDDEGNVVCDTVGSTTREHYDYNAHLIAAAPEMYEILLECLDDELEMHGTTSLSNKISQSLAKARGEL